MEILIGAYDKIYMKYIEVLNEHKGKRIQWPGVGLESKRIFWIQLLYGCLIVHSHAGKQIMGHI